MELPSGLFIAIGALLAGLITGTISFLGLVVAKEQKITEFRENRRLRIREETAVFLAELDTLFKLYEAELNCLGQTEFDKNQLNDFRQKYKSNLKTLSEMRHRMYLRATPERSDKMVALLKEIEAEFYGTEARQEELNRIRDDIIATTQRTLKYEWERVKKGEPIYVQAEKWALRVARISGFILATAVVLGIFISLFNYEISGSNEVIGSHTETPKLNQTTSP